MQVHNQEHTDQSDVTDHVLDVNKNMAEFDEQLICAVKEGPCFYNVRSSDFKVTWKEENAWVAISNKLNSTG